MKFLKNVIFVSCVHLLVVSGLAAMTGDGKVPLLGASGGGATKPSYGAFGTGAHGATDGKGAKSTAGGSDAHASESKDADALTPEAFFAHIRAGNLTDVARFLESNPNLSQCELAVESGVKSAIWYALELALSATVGPEATKALQI